MEKYTTTFPCERSWRRSDELQRGVAIQILKQCSLLLRAGDLSNRSGGLWACLLSRCGIGRRELYTFVVIAWAKNHCITDGLAERLSLARNSRHFVGTPRGMVQLTVVHSLCMSDTTTSLHRTRFIWACRSCFQAQS